MPNRQRRSHHSALRRWHKRYSPLLWPILLAVALRAAWLSLSPAMSGSLKALSARAISASFRPFPPSQGRAAFIQSFPLPSVT